MIETPHGQKNRGWNSREWRPTDFQKRTELTATQREFIEYLLDPSSCEQKGTYEQWGKEHGVSREALRRWKKEQLFIEEWDRRAHQVFGGIERLQMVIDALFEKAQNGDTKAAQLYLQYVDKLTPTRKVIHEDRRVSELTDEELADKYENVLALRKGASTA